jgi:hypothetical protein
VEFQVGWHSASVMGHRPPMNQFVLVTTLSFLFISSCTPDCRPDIGSEEIGFLGAFDAFTGDAEIISNDPERLTLRTVDGDQEFVIPLQPDDDLAAGQRGTLIRNGSWMQLSDSEGLVVEIVSGGEGRLPDPHMVISDESAGSQCAVGDRLREPVLVKIGDVTLGETPSGEPASATVPLGAQSFRFVVFSAARSSAAPLTEDQYGVLSFAEAMVVRQRTD